MTTPLGTASSGETPPPQGITEQDIAEYLVHTPGFFERHAELLGAIQLTSPHGHRAVSLQERQMEMLRERIKGLELKIIEMIRHGQENMVMSERLHQWTRAILTTENPADLPARVVAELKHQFLIPQGALRLWDVDAAYAQCGGKKTWKNDAVRVAFLFELYQRITSLLPSTTRKRTRK